VDARAWPLGVALNNASGQNARKVTRNLGTNVHNGDARHPREARRSVHPIIAPSNFE